MPPFLISDNRPYGFLSNVGLRIAFLSFLIFGILKTYAQDLPGVVSSADLPRYNSAVRVMFYNTENLFDVEDDSLKNDADYLPGGSYNWNKSRLYSKLQNLSKVIMALGGWEAPEIIGLCEVENKNVLQQLLNLTPLKRFPYRFVHYESPDRRGIDVALLYRADKFSLISSFPIPLLFESEDSGRTRDILYVKGLVMHKDTVHFFVNHWPSRFGGHIETNPLRCQAGKLLKSKVDSILQANPNASVVLMGDFNDEPGDYSLNKCLGAAADTLMKAENQLFNLMGPLKRMGAGTHAFNDFTGWEYSLLDQIIVSPSLLSPSARIGIRENRAWIFAAPFMIQTSDDGGRRPLRTYSGRSYLGGFSDHYPVFIDLIIR